MFFFRNSKNLLFGFFGSLKFFQFCFGYVRMLLHNPSSSFRSIYIHGAKTTWLDKAVLVKKFIHSCTCTFGSQSKSAKTESNIVEVKN